MLSTALRRARRPSAPQADFIGLPGRRLTGKAALPADPPRHPSLLNHIFEHLFVLQRIHRAPEALMLERQELVVLDQPPEGFFDQLLAIAQIVEDLRAKDKEAAVDPEVGILRRRVCRSTFPSPSISMRCRLNDGRAATKQATFPLCLNVSIMAGRSTSESPSL